MSADEALPAASPRRAPDEVRAGEESTSTPPLDRLRRACLALPEAFEQEAWGEPTFRVRKRMFAMYAGSGTHHGAGRNAVWCNAPLGVQELLVGSDPDRFFVPPYVGVKGWVGVDLERVDDAELNELVLQSYCIVAPARLRRLADPPRS